MTSGRRLPPHDLTAEQAVLSGLLQFSEELMPQVAADLKADDFYDRRHGLIYQAMAWLYDRNNPVDEITVVSRLRDAGDLDSAGGIDFVVSLADIAITPGNVEYYTGLVRDKAHLRSFVLIASQAIDSIYQDQEDPEQNLEAAESAIFKATERRYAHKISSLEQVMPEALRLVEARFRNKHLITGVTTGFSKLDEITNGLQPSELIIIAGRPGMGKTALALNIGLNAAVEGQVTVAVFSLEMSKEQLGLRLLSSMAKVLGEKLRSGFLSADDFARLVPTADRLSRAPLFIDDTPAISILELRAKARRLAQQQKNSPPKLGLIIIDYLQLMSGRRDKFDSREQEISDISRSLKALARELKIPVMALSQLNRKVEDRPGGNKRPQLSDLRESGAIEQEADVIAFIYQESMYNKEAEEGLAEIIIGKQRNGPTGIVELSFLKQYTCFANHTDKDSPEKY